VEYLYYPVYGSKYKARMNANGKEQIQGVHYEETYAPAVGWATV
jgi:hypothetical protein